MNIFNILSRGKSRLHEPSISAMLGYLLSPTDDHGLNDTFLKSFLLQVDKKLNKNIFSELFKRPNLLVEVNLEVSYFLKGSYKYVDVQLSLYDKLMSKELHRIIIENKIKTSSANSTQLFEYYQTVIADEDYINESPQLTIIFITPHINNTNLDIEYETLEKKKDSNIYSLRLYWCSNDDDDEETIVKLIRDILQKEIKAEINPINEYMRQTLKAFVYYISETITINYDNAKKFRFGEDIGKINETYTFELKSGELFEIVRRDSGQIQVFTLPDHEKVSNNKEVIRNYLKEKDIWETINKDNSNKLTTRRLGTLLIKNLRGIMDP
ncbi:MAG: PD-(D/E)XK nuclease family protein [Candidatus Magnetoovum sp. WYHC-5]|nr:PD-(D/E)XK nuclease family protein [Candidatus Magnetoovum sp. WYHC-5]